MAEFAVKSQLAMSSTVALSIAWLKTTVAVAPSQEQLSFTTITGALVIVISMSSFVTVTGAVGLKMPEKVGAVVPFDATALMPPRFLTVTVYS